ncbi:6-phosphogluconolactonase [Parenemella sanctibonifatiensis]|uniref:Glucosamine-6-phosphate deaminase n=1 Tax=Parenemella sanctibonifatiensis TaxID=2016505 RepID=A0A255E2L4_9ACTN|nr:6-phosphogluconolactonase [Parenemella sanctibonifatiensis]OYN85211.1 glucosamine-6-phosphate deaminase [Parenemella sanctibonifatiensis]
MTSERYQDLQVEFHSTTAELGAAAAKQAAEIINAAIDSNGSARVVVATGNSQFPITDALPSQDVDWSKVTVFHMDEYVGIDANHPASFRRWIRERVEERLHPAQVHYIDGNADPETEARRYEDLLHEAPLDLVCMGIGENGHLAFNEPGVAEFDTERWCQEIALTPESLRQQVNEGHFPTQADVPATALSLSIPALLSSTHQIVCVPEERKAAAVAAALTGPITTDCPASILQRTPTATLHLDPESASQLPK